MNTKPKQLKEKWKTTESGSLSIFPVAMWLQRNRWIAAAEITVIDETNNWAKAQYFQLTVTKFRPHPMQQSAKQSVITYELRYEDFANIYE